MVRFWENINWYRKATYRWNRKCNIVSGGESETTGWLVTMRWWKHLKLTPKSETNTNSELNSHHYIKNMERLQHQKTFKRVFWVIIYGILIKLSLIKYVRNE